MEICSNRRASQSIRSCLLSYNGSSDLVAVTMATSSPSPSPSTDPMIDDRLDPTEFELRKRLPPRFATRPNDVYITERTDFKAQMNRCQKMLDNGVQEIYIHGLGNAVKRTINLGLQLKRRAMGSVELDVNTSTVQVTDDLFPLIDDGDLRIRKRFVSGIHIRVFRPEVPVVGY